MTESRAHYQTTASNSTNAAPPPPPTPAERIRPIVEWLERKVAPLMAEGSRARVELHIKGDHVSVELTLPETIS